MESKKVLHPCFFCVAFIENGSYYHFCRDDEGVSAGGARGIVAVTLGSS